MPVSLADIEAASRGDRNALRRALNRIKDSLEHIAKLAGVNPSPTPTATEQKTLPTPPNLYLINVVGANGRFRVTITPPPDDVDNRAAAVPTIFEDFDPSEQGRGRDGDPYHRRDARRSRAKKVKHPTIVTPAAKVILFELQSATALTFDAAGNMVSYGPASQVYYEISDSGATRFFRVRGARPDSKFGDWVYYTSVAACGPVAVAAGV